MSETPIPVAVVGAGNMGKNHVRVYEQLAGAELVEVVEPDDERAADIESTYDISVVEEVADIECAVAATIAVPNRYHRDVALKCIEMGLDVLVEKPLAPTVKDAKAIARAAREADRILQVGHIERFNPAVRTLRDLLDTEQPIAFEAHRLGPFEDHLSGENVVLDLMIHDLDVIESLVPADVVDLQAVGVSPMSDECDYATVILEFENGTVATLVSSHVTQGMVRELSVTTPDAYMNLEYQSQDITIRQRGTSEATTLFDQSGFRTETVSVSPYIKTGEPLKKELEHFISCVRKRDEPEVGAADGIRAVRRAAQITRAID